MWQAAKCALPRILIRSSVVATTRFLLPRKGAWIPDGEGNKTCRGASLVIPASTGCSGIADQPRAKPH